MNILFLSRSGGYAGSTYSIIYLATSLAARGHRVCLSCPPDTIMHRELEDSAVTVYPLRMKRRAFHLPTIRKIAEIARENDIDIINAQASSDRYLSIFARHLFKIDAAVVHTRRQIPLSQGNVIQNALYARGTDAIVAVSSGVKQRLVEIGLPADHIHVIHNGTPPEKYGGIDEELVTRLGCRYGILPGDRVIGCVSRLKQQDRLLRVLDRLDTDIKVMFIGCHRDEFEKRFGRISARQDIIFTGELDNRTTLHCYRLFTVNVLCSITEGLSQNLLEAMAMGVPVVATRAAGNIDLIHEGENGLMFRDGDTYECFTSITRALTDRRLRERLIQNGRRTAFETFSMNATVLAYEALFRKLLEHRRRNGGPAGPSPVTPAGQTVHEAPVAEPRA